MRRRESVLLARANGDAQRAKLCRMQTAACRSQGQSVIRRPTRRFRVVLVARCFVGCNKRSISPRRCRNLAAANPRPTPPRNPRPQRRRTTRRQTQAKGDTPVAPLAPLQERRSRARPPRQEGVVVGFIVRVGREKRLAGAGKPEPGKGAAPTPGPLPPGARGNRFAITRVRERFRDPKSIAM